MILIVSATKNEVLPLLNGSEQPCVGIPLLLDAFSRNDAEILVTGVGAVPTTFWLSNILNQKKYDLVINVGVAGTFNPEISLGDVVLVREDLFADYGIDNQGKFISLFESGLCNQNQNPFNKGRMQWPYADRFHYLNHFTRVNGITVATAS